MNHSFEPNCSEWFMDHPRDNAKPNGRLWYSPNLEGASIKYVRTEGEGGGLKAKKYAYDSADRLQEKHTRGGRGSKKSGKSAFAFVLYGSSPTKNSNTDFEWLTASGTWFGEILVCCCLTGLAWLCLGVGVSPNHVPEAVHHWPLGYFDDIRTSLGAFLTTPCHCPNHETYQYYRHILGYPLPSPFSARTSLKYRP